VNSARSHSASDAEEIGSGDGYQVGARQVGKHDVHESQVGRPRANFVQTRQAVGGHINGIAFARETPGHQVGHVPFVFDDHDAFLGQGTGILRSEPRGHNAPNAI